MGEGVANKDGSNLVSQISEERSVSSDEDGTKKREESALLPSLTDGNQTGNINLGEGLANNDGSNLVSQSQQGIENAADMAAEEGMSAELSVVESPLRQRKRRVEETVNRMTTQMLKGVIKYDLRKETWKARKETIDHLIHGHPKKTIKRQRRTGCSAGASCRLPEGELRLTSNDNGSSTASKCIKCGNISHDCCSYMWNNQVFCLDCLKEEVNNTCSTVETFEAILNRNKHQNSNDVSHTIGELDLRQSVDNYLRNEAKLDMNLEQYFNQKANISMSLSESKKTCDKKRWLDRQSKFLLMKKKYNACIAAAKEDWILSKDGVVNGLCYNPRRCEYVASVKYMDENNVQKESEMRVPFAWVVDEYGPVLANKLRDVAENNYFMKTPLDTNGHATYFQHEGKDIVRVRYSVAKKVTNQEGMEGTNRQDIWHGMTSDGTVVALEEGVIRKEFGDMFVDDCKRWSNGRVVPHDANGYLVRERLDTQKVARVKYCPTNESGRQWIGLLEGKSKEITLTEDDVERQFGYKFKDECKIAGKNRFVHIPIGSCKSSLMKMYPELKCEKAPVIRYRQKGNSCVMSSLASAFHSTGIEELKAIAHILHTTTKEVAGRMGAMSEAMNIVKQKAAWLQPKKLKPTFDCLKDMNNYMFVLCVLRDSANSCQHAVTIFRKWVFDSNEPYALPLCKRSLDLCTWDVRDGVVNEESSFIAVKMGWIFSEDISKKKKQLDQCKI